MGNTLHKKYGEFILEYLHNDENYLLKFLSMSKKEKCVDIAYSFPYFLLDFLESEEPLLPENERNIFDDLANGSIEDYEVMDLISNGLKEKYGQWLFDNSHYIADDPHLPTWYYMDNARLIKKQWLIHQTDKASEIWRNGFKYGMDDMTKLGLTTSFEDKAKESGGFNFAYTIPDYERYGKKGRYGDEIILLRSSGVRAWHNGDEEYQTIFLGKTAEDIVWAGESDRGYMISSRINDKKLVEKETIVELVDWIDINYSQYYRHIFNRSLINIDPNK